MSLNEKQQVPRGWRSIPLSEVAAEKIVYGIVQAGPHDPDGVPYLKSSDIGGLIDTGGLQRTSLAIHAKFRRSRVVPGDIVISLRGNTGVTSVVPPTLPEANLTQGTARIAVNKEHSSAFIRQQIASSSTQRLIQAATKGSTFVEITLDDLRQIEILCPPLPEQRRIAEILSTWDRAIDTVEALIANASTRRVALIDSLLDNPEWPLRQLSSLGELSSAGVDKKSHQNERPVRLLNFVDVLRRDFIEAGSLSHWVTAPERQISKCDVRCGDIFFTPSSETRDDIAHSAVAAEDIASAAYSYHVVRFRLAEPWPLSFRAYAFKSKAFMKQAQALCAGSGQRYVLSQKQFGSIAVHVPPLEAQQKIGELLRTIDQERNALVAQAAALHQEKAALMQQLLTGKRRVQSAEIEAVNA